MELLSWKKCQNVLNTSRYFTAAEKEWDLSVCWFFHPVKCIHPFVTSITDLRQVSNEIGNLKVVYPCDLSSLDFCYLLLYKYNNWYNNININITIYIPSFLPPSFPPSLPPFFPFSNCLVLLFILDLSTFDLISVLKARAWNIFNEHIFTI